MIWFLLNILILTFIQLIFSGEGRAVAGIRPDPLQRAKTGKKWICIVGTINWILLSGLRSLDIGADTMQYKVNFLETKTRSWGALFDDFSARFFQGEDIKDPGYGLFVKFCQIFTDNYQVFLIIVAVVFFVLMGVAIYKYSDNPYQSFLLFSALFYSFFAITGIRQTLATALVVFGGMKFIKERKLIPFLLLFVIAIPLHFSSICFLPFYFISRIKINKGTLCGYWVAIGLSYAFRGPFMNFLKGIAGYESYEFEEGAAAGIFVFLLIAIAFVTTVFYRHLVDENNTMTTIAINAVFIACIFSSFLLINQSMMRVVQYYSVFLLFLLPKFVKIFKDNFSASCYKMVYVAALVLLLVRNNPEYAFFWM